MIFRVGRTYQKSHTERGEAEVMFFGIILIICGVISGGLLILNWVKDYKNSKVDARREMLFAKGTPTPFSLPRDPAQYYAHCKKPSWAVTQTDFQCEILPESYRELEFLLE